MAIDILPSDMTAEQLALPGSQRVTATTRYGKIVGGRVKNGCQVFLSMLSLPILVICLFLDVPYGIDVPRWHDPQKLPDTYQYEDREYIIDGKYCAQPTLALASLSKRRLSNGMKTDDKYLHVISLVSASQPRTHSLPTYPYLRPMIWISRRHRSQCECLFMAASYSMAVRVGHQTSSSFVRRNMERSR